MNNPIFIGYTRSFWSVVAAVALFREQGEPAVRAVMTLLAAVAGADADLWTAWAMDVLPVASLLLALHQRRGSNRPYTADPRAL